MTIMMRRVVFTAAAVLGLAGCGTAEDTGADDKAIGVAKQALCLHNCRDERVNSQGRYCYTCSCESGATMEVCFTNRIGTNVEDQTGIAIVE